MTKMASIGDFLTDAQIRQVRRLGDDVKAVEEQVIKPNMKHINEKLGQENDSKYLAYAVIYAVQGGVSN